MKPFRALAPLLALLLFSIGAQAAVCVYEQNDTSGVMPGGNTWIDRFTTVNAATVSSVQVYFSNTSDSNGYIGIYDDNFGSPGNKLAESALTVFNDGWNDVSLLSSVPLDAATDYWVAVAIDDVGTFVGTTFDFMSDMHMTGSYNVLPANGSGASSAGNTERLALILGDCAAPTPTETFTPLAIDSPTSTPTATPTNTEIPVGSPTFTLTRTLTATPSATPTATRTATSTVSPSFTPSVTHSPTATPSGTSTHSPTATQSATPSATRTITPTATPTFTATPTSTPTPYCLVGTLAGNGSASSTGDGGAATSATLNSPAAVAVDDKGGIYVVEAGSHVVRRIASNFSSITRIAGTGSAGYSGEGLTATASQLDGPQAVVVDVTGAVYIADTGNHRVRRLDPNSGQLVTVAGTGVAGADGLSSTAAATSLPLNSPAGLLIDFDGNLYIADTGNHAIRRVDPSGQMSTVAGTGASGFAGVGVTVTATSGQLNQPRGLALGSDNGIYVADTGNHAIRRIFGGQLTTVAGNGSPGFAGLTVTVAAAGAALTQPWGLASSSNGDLFVSEKGQHVVRVISGGQLSRLAGLATPGFGGDGSIALGVTVNSPAGLAILSNGNILLADEGNHRLRLMFSCTDGPVAFERPSLPACDFGVNVGSAASIKDPSTATAEVVIAVKGLLAPNPVRAGSPLCVVFNTPVRSIKARIYNINAELVAGGAEGSGERLCLAAPPKAGVYFLAAEATSLQGERVRKTHKFAVVQP